MLLLEMLNSQRGGMNGSEKLVLSDQSKSPPSEINAPLAVVML
jgi:hypothetical protein